MLWEMTRAAFTRCPSAAASLGYRREGVAIESRARRLGRAWAPHLAACKRVILDTARQAEAGRLCVVLGSGALLDIPANTLAQLFERVVLVDLSHPPPARALARKHRSVSLLTHDVTGVVERLAAMGPGDADPLPDAPLPLIGEADFVISSMLVSQLPLLPQRRLAVLGRDEGTLERFGAALQSAHLEALGTARGTVCLISDIQWSEWDGDRALAHGALVPGGALPVAGQAWWWDLAPRPELYPDRDRRHRVVGGRMVR